MSSQRSAITGNVFTDCYQSAKKQGSERAMAKFGGGAHLEMQGSRF